MRLSLSTLLRTALVALLLTGAIPAAHALQEASSKPSSAGTRTTPEAAGSEQKKEAEDENDAYLKSPSVQKFGKLFGLNADQAATTFTVLNFVVLAGLVGLFLVKILPKIFRDRNTAIQKHLVDARTATEEASARLNSVEERLSKLDGQIAAMKSQSEADSVKDEARIKASVEDEKAKILAAAEQEISAATIHAQRQIQKYAAELAIEQAARKLTISAETDRLLVQNFARNLGADESKEGQN
jgi:F-type H+-transporting ATPase subunit b